MHFDAARDERGADGVLGRERVAARRDDLGARVGEQRCEVRGLRLEVHDDGNALAPQSSVGEAVTREPVQHGRVARHPGDPPLALVGEPDVRYTGPRSGVCDCHAWRLSRRETRYRAAFSGTAAG